MILTDLFKHSLKALASRRLRSLLTIIMVTVGVALIIGLNGMTTGLNHFITKQLGVVGAETISVLPGRTASIKITDFVVQEIGQIPGVKTASPYLQRTATVRSGGDAESLILIGINQPDLPLIYPSIKIKEGGLVPQRDQTGILLGGRVANPLESSVPFARFNSGVIVEVVNAGEKTPQRRMLIVKGIIDTTGFPLVDRGAFVTLQTAKSLFNRESEYEGIYVVANNPASVDKIEEEIISMYGRDLIVLSFKEMTRMVQQITGTLQLFTGSIASVSLIVATVGIVATMYTSVRERTREIGVTKSIGFTDRMVLTLFLFEALIIGVIGGSIGVVGGVGISYLLTFVFGRFETSPPEGMRGGGFGGGFGLEGLTPVFDPTMLTLVWLLSLVLSLVGGAYPAWRASRLNPIDALRGE